MTAVRLQVTRWRSSITLAFALGGIAIATFGSRLPSIQKSLGVSEGIIGTALMGLAVGSVAGLSIAAWVHTHLGARRGVGGCLSVIALGIALIGLGAVVGHSLAAAAVGLVAIGLGIGVLDVLMNVEGAAIEQAVGRTLRPQLHGAWSAGVIIGAALGALSAVLGVAAQWQFSAEAVLILVAARYVVAGIPRHEIGPDETAGHRLRGERLRHWARTWFNGKLLLIGVVMLGAELGEGSANNWLTLAARDGHHHSEAVAGGFYVLFAAAETLVRLLGGALVDRLGPVAVIRATSAAGVAGVLLFILTDPWWLSGLGVILWAIGVSMGFPLGMSAAAESGPDRAAQVSVVATLGYVANLAGPPTLGILADHVGLLRSLGVLPALLTIACLCAGALRTKTSANSTA